MVLVISLFDTAHICMDKCFVTHIWHEVQQFLKEHFLIVLTIPIQSKLVTWVPILFYLCHQMYRGFKIVNLSIVRPLLWFVRWAKGSGWSDEKLHRGELKLQRVQFGLGEEPQHCNGDTLTDALSNQSRWAARTLFFYQCIKIWRLEEKWLPRPLKSF